MSNKRSKPIPVAELPPGLINEIKIAIRDVMENRKEKRFHHLTEIKRHYNISRRTLNGLISGAYYPAIPPSLVGIRYLRGKGNRSSRHRSLTDDQVRQIRKLFHEKRYSVSMIKKEMGLSLSKMAIWLTANREMYIAIPDDDDAEEDR